MGVREIILLIGLEDMIFRIEPFLIKYWEVGFVFLELKIIFGMGEVSKLEYLRHRTFIDIRTLLS